MTSTVLHIDASARHAHPPPADAWAVAQVLETEHGWSENEIRGLMGENLMRVYKANWGE